MGRQPWLRCLLLVLAGLALGGEPSTSGAPLTPEAPSASPEARDARRIALALEEGRVAEALGDAKAAAKRHPESALLQLRLAQAQLGLAVQLDGQFGQAIQDAAWDRTLTRMVNILRNEPAPNPGQNLEEHEKMRKQLQEVGKILLPDSALAAITDFQQRARQEMKESGSLLEHRTRAALDAFAALKEARRLGDTSTELELTDLWAHVVPLLWRHEVEALGKRSPPAFPDATHGPTAADPLKEQLTELQKALAPFDSVQEDAVLRAAAELGRLRSADPEALAGAADVIAVTAGISGKPVPSREHIRALIEGWPGYDWLLTTLQDAQRFELGEPPNPRGSRPPASPQEAAQQMGYRQLRLNLADLLCQAPDYADQASGIDEKAGVLRELLARKDQLTPEQRLALQRQQEEHARAFAGYPTTRSFAQLKVNGLNFFEFPQLGVPDRSPEGPIVSMFSKGEIAISSVPPNYKRP